MKKLYALCQQGKHKECKKKSCKCPCHTPPWIDPEVELTLYVSPDIRARLNLPRRIKTTAEYLAALGVRP